MSNGVRRLRLMGADIILPPSIGGVQEEADHGNILVPHNQQSHSPIVTVHSAPVAHINSQPSGSSFPGQINVADDDEVILLSHTTFEEARNSSQTIAEGTLDLNVEPVEMYDGFAVRSHQRRILDMHEEVAINYAGYMDFDVMEGLGSSSLENQHLIVPSPYVVPPVVPPPPPSTPPPERTFTCPICMGLLVEEVATKCGHIFCKSCIRTAIAIDRKCPTCRLKVNIRQLLRIYLPAIN